jgi:hypothetical protein
VTNYACVEATKSGTRWRLARVVRRLMRWMHLGQNLISHIMCHALETVTKQDRARSAGRRCQFAEAGGDDKEEVM